MPKAAPEEELRMPFWSHLEELRKRIVNSVLAISVGFGVCFNFSENILKLLLQPMNTKVTFRAAFPFLSFVPHQAEQKLHFTTLTEPFWAHLKIALIAGLMLAFPVIMHQLWKFISPGLLPKERRFAGTFVLFSTFFFAIGVLFCYVLLLPFAVPFLLEYKTEQLIPIIRIGEYIDFMLKFLLACGAVFELPLVITLLSRMGILSTGWLVKNRKFAFLLSFMVGAILTPTQDIFNMTLLSLPIYLLYEIGIIASRIFGKKKSESTDLTET